MAERMATLRHNVRDLLNPKLAGHGGRRDKSTESGQVVIHNLTNRTESNYVLSRLKRDDPTLWTYVHGVRPVTRSPGRWA